MGQIRQLDFTPMDSFIAHVLEAFKTDAELAVRIFPTDAAVVLSFCDRVVTDVIGEYINSLLSSARAISPHLFLQATPASFIQAWKLVDVVVSISDTPRDLVESTIYRMFESHLDEYLDEETDTIKSILESICSSWDKHLGQDTSRSEGPTFLTAQNPDQVKRNVMAGFMDVLLLPVTIVPRTVGFGVNALVAGSNQAVSGLSMLNPQKWGGNNGARVIKGDDNDVLFDVPSAADDREKPILDEKRGSVVSTGSRGSKGGDFDSLQLLVSLDTALELIQADRDSLKRCETFAKYPGKNGAKVREAIEEIFIHLLKAVGDRHIAPGFKV